MIGVCCEDSELDVVRELFELFKTPWVRCDDGSRHDVVIVSTQRPAASFDARLVIALAPATHRGVGAGSPAPRIVTEHGTPLPIYCGVDGESVVERETANRTVIRCPYNLFSEVRHLLTIGQPPEHARTPTLELHFALLRRWIADAGLPLVEIPPVPPGCDLIGCLTHDVDFLGMRRHGLDATLLGFLYRATIGSLLDVVAGRRTVRQLLRNWRAALEVPFVHLRLLDDPWIPFDRYAEVEGNLRSTFFIVPFAHCAGRGPDGPSDPRRAVPYGVEETREHVDGLRARGCEVAVHGIDAWNDVTRGRAERGAVASVAGADALGVRMHWLYFDEGSPAKLDDAGYEYDATVGYNDAVGFRAGTTQAYRPLGCERLLELPLHVQDTALLYPRRMHLREREALALCRDLADRTRQLGGVLTISWHERSLVPERQWDGVYRELLAMLRQRGAGVMTAGEAVAWFRLRRSVDLEGADMNDAASLLEDGDAGDGEATLRLRIHRPGGAHVDTPVGVEALRRVASAGRALRI